MKKTRCPKGSRKCAATGNCVHRSYRVIPKCKSGFRKCINQVCYDKNTRKNKAAHKIQKTFRNYKRKKAAKMIQRSFKSFSKRQESFRNRPNTLSTPSSSIPSLVSSPISSIISSFKSLSSSTPSSNYFSSSSSASSSPLSSLTPSSPSPSPSSTPSASPSASPSPSPSVVPYKKKKEPVVSSYNLRNRRITKYNLRSSLRSTQKKKK